MEKRHTLDPADIELTLLFESMAASETEAEWQAEAQKLVMHCVRHRDIYLTEDKASSFLQMLYASSLAVQIKRHRNMGAKTSRIPMYMFLRGVAAGYQAIDLRAEVLPIGFLLKAYDAFTFMWVATKTHPLCVGESDFLSSRRFASTTHTVRRLSKDSKLWGDPLNIGGSKVPLDALRSGTAAHEWVVAKVREKLPSIDEWGVLCIGKAHIIPAVRAAMIGARSRAADPGVHKTEVALFEHITWESTLFEPETGRRLEGRDYHGCDSWIESLVRGGDKKDLPLADTSTQTTNTVRKEASGRPLGKASFIDEAPTTRGVPSAIDRRVDLRSLPLENNTNPYHDDQLPWPLALMFLLPIGIGIGFKLWDITPLSPMYWGISSAVWFGVLGVVSAGFTLGLSVGAGVVHRRQLLEERRKRWREIE